MAAGHDWRGAPLMAGLLSFLGGLNQAAMAADTGRLEGAEVKRRREHQTLTDQLARERQAAQDQLTERNLLSMIAARDAETARAAQPQSRNIDPNSPEGIEARLDYERQVRQLPSARPSAPQGPVRGTPAYEDMLRREAAARASGGGGERGAQLPAPAIEKMIELDDLIGQAQRASQSIGSAVAAGKNVTGRVGGVIPVPNWLRNAVGQGGDEGTAARAELANISSSIFKMRSGAAVTPQEFSRLEPFLANDDDDESVVMIKLRKLRQALDDIKRIRLDNYQRYGKPGIAVPRGVDEDTGVDLDAAIDAVLGRQP